MADRADGPEQGQQEVAGPLVRECPPPYQRCSGQYAAVLLYRNGGYSVLWPHRREDFGKPWLGGPYTVFEVLLGRNVTAFELRLPAAGDADVFVAEIRVHWEVEDPYAVVRNRVWDVASLLHDELHAQLRRISRRYRPTEAQRAEEAARAELDSGRFALGEDLGLRIRAHVFIDLDVRNRDQVREFSDLDRELDLADRQHAVRNRREEHEQRLVRERARALEAVLMRGDTAEIAHYMARDPERALEIRRLFREEQREEQEDRLALLNKFIDSGLVERHDIGEHMYEAIQYLRERAGGVLGGPVDGTVLPDRERPRALDSGSPSRTGRRRPFWEDDSPGNGRVGGPGEPDGHGGPDRYDGYGEDGEDGERGWDDRREGSRPAAPDGRRIHEPTRVESSAERARYGERPRSGRPSDGFDDWDDE